MRTALAFTLAASLLVAPALADDTDRFNVKGTTPDGATYAGSVVLTELDTGSKLDGSAFTVVWTIGGETIEGTGLISSKNRKLLSIAYIQKGHLGVALITDSGDSASGVWWTEGLPGSGTEAWTKQ